MKNITACLSFGLFSAFFLILPARADYTPLDCNNAGAQYFTCQNRIEKTCMVYPKSVLRAPGPVTPSSYCTTANMDFLSCSGGQGVDPACATPSVTTPLGCCILTPISVGGKSVCVDVANTAQATACINKDVNVFSGITTGVNFKWNAGKECASFTECAIAPPSTQAAGTTDPLKDLLIKSPGISIKIPGLDFSNINKADAEGYLYIPWIAEYMTALYKFLIGIVSIVAVVMIIIQGARVVTSGGGEAKMDAYKKIFRAIIGLVIAWGSYAILYTVNPNLVTFNALKVKYIEPQQLEGEGEKNLDSEQAYDQANFSGAAGSISGLLGGSPKGAPCSKEAAIDAATRLDQLGVCVSPCHCAWTATAFLQYIGCGNIDSTFPLGALLKATAQGWKVQTITSDNRYSLPLGLLITPGAGHAGVSLGNGQQFQSGGGSFSSFISKHPDAKNCPSKVADAVANPSACSVCAKLKGHEPSSNRFGVCDTNQGWIMGKISGWGYIIIPPSQIQNFPGGISNNPIEATITGNKKKKYGTAMIDKDVCDSTQQNKDPNDRWCNKN
jgi:hypothetical protein